MNFYTYGDYGNPAVVLIHGAGWSYWLYLRQAQALSSHYYVILPELNGHGAANNEAFVSADHSAGEILRYLAEQKIHKLHLLSGVSLGGQVAICMLTQAPDIATRAIIESALCVPTPGLADFSKGINKYFGKMLFSRGFNSWALRYMPKSMKLPKEIETLYLDAIGSFSPSTLDRIYDTYCYYRLQEGLKACTADLRFWYGSKEDKRIRESAHAFKKYLESAGKSCTLTELKGYRHAQLSTYEPEKWLDLAK